MSEQVEVYVDNVLATRRKACLCEIGNEQHWIPWRVIDKGSDIKSVGDSGTAYIAPWFAERVGLA